jgi:hypothetical protein
VPGHGPVRGRYYFLPRGVEFWQRSLLGGWWWERPFQTGPFATLPTPRPTWVDGSTDFPHRGAPICPCGVEGGEFVPVRAQLHMIRESGETWTGDQIFFEFAPGVMQAVFRPPTNNETNFAFEWGVCQTVSFEGCFDVYAPIWSGEIVIEQGQPDGYRFTSVFKKREASYFEVLVCEPIDCYVRWFA